MALLPACIQSTREGNVLTSVCLSVHMGGGENEPTLDGGTYLGHLGQGYLPWMGGGTYFRWGYLPWMGGYLL